MNNTISPARLKLLAASSFVLILIPVLFIALWVHSFNSRTNQAERVAMYNSYFPGFLNGRFTIAIISIVCCLAAIYLSGKYWRNKSLFLKLVSIIIIGAGGLMVLMNVFSFM